MKKIFFIAGFIVMGLFLKIDVSFASDRWEWKPTGPTAEDILSATRVENLAAKGSREDKLINAVKNGDLKNVKTFIAAGVDLEAKDNNDMTALMTAAEKGYSDIVKILIDAGADISTKNKFHCTAFFWAADKNQVDIVKMLIAKGAAADSTFEEFFVKAAFEGNTEMMKALIIDSARIKRDTLDTAYHLASCKRYRNPELFNVIAKALNKEPQ